MSYRIQAIELNVIPDETQAAEKNYALPNMSKILVTGAQGLIGSSLVPYLETCGHDVLRAARKKGVDIQVDLTNIKQVCNALGNSKPDVIINLAALTNVDECEKKPQQAYLANVLIVENLSNWIRKYGKNCYLIQISTDQVYDGPGPHRENDITLTNYYGFSKYAGELAAATIQSTVLRTNIFGRSQCPDRTSLSDWFVQSLRRGKEVKVFNDVRISSLSFHTLFSLIQIVIEKRIPGIFNLGSKEGMSKADFAFSLAELLGISTRNMSRCTSEDANLFAYRPKDMSMNSSNFEKLFGVELPTMKQEIHSIKADYFYETR